jgi:hypothetical protein
LKDFALRGKLSKPVHTELPQEEFATFSHPGTQKPLQPCSKGASLLLKLAAVLGIIHMITKCGFASIQNVRLTGSLKLPHRFQRKAWQARP